MRSKQKFVGAWFSEIEYHHLHQQMEKSGQSASDILRELVMGLDVKPRPERDAAELLHHLSAIGNNINQIAHTANATRSVTTSQVKELRGLLEEVWQAVMENY